MPKAKIEIDISGVPDEPGIYAIINTVSGTYYIGSSCRLRRRCRQHFSSLQRGVRANRHFLNAWRKYGPDAFVFEVLEFCDRDDLLKREQHYVDTCSFPLYNVGKIVDRPSLGRPVSKEQRLRISLTKKAQMRRMSEATKQLIRKTKAQYPYSPTPEHIARREANRKPVTDLTKERMRAASAASTYEHSLETRVKMSASIAAAHKANPKIMTEEWKANIRAGQAARNWQPTAEWLENTRRGIASRKREYTPEQVAKQLATKAKNPYIQTPEQKAKWHAARKANAKKMSQESIAKMIATRAEKRQLKIAAGLITPKQTKKAA